METYESFSTPLVCCPSCYDQLYKKCFKLTSYQSCHHQLTQPDIRVRVRDISAEVTPLRNDLNHGAITNIIKDTVI